MSQDEGGARSSSAFAPLSPVEARVLAVLVEKASTVPDSYPLSLNALQSGCNQKSARAALMDLGDADVIDAVDELKRRHLVVEVSGARVARYDHNAARGLSVPSQSVALLATLVLRGPQTPAELRLHSERLHRFADVSSVEAFLDELAQRDPPYVKRLARAPGSREARWAHLLCGEPPESSGAATGAKNSEAGDATADLRATVERLVEEVARLRQDLDDLRAASR